MFGLFGGYTLVWLPVGSYTSDLTQAQAQWDPTHWAHSHMLVPDSSSTRYCFISPITCQTTRSILNFTAEIMTDGDSCIAVQLEVGMALWLMHAFLYNTILCIHIHTYGCIKHQIPYHACRRSYRKNDLNVQLATSYTDLLQAAVWDHLVALLPICPISPKVWQLVTYFSIFLYCTP